MQAKNRYTSGMDANQQEALKKFVINELAKHRRQSDVTQSVCEKTGLYWDEAERFVQEVAETYHLQVRRKRSPILVALSMAIALAGLGLVLMTIYTISGIVIFHRSTQPEVLSTLNILMLIVNEASTAVWLGSIGLAMLVGGMLGMQQVWSDWLER
jgi:hypothetical protein